MSRCVQIVELRIDGEEVPCENKLRTVFFSNISSVMGLADFSPAGNPADGILELRSIRSALGYLTLPFGFHASSSPVLAGKRWEFELDRAVSFQVDGEDFSHVLSSRFRLEFERSIKFCSGPVGLAA